MGAESPPTVGWLLLIGVFIGAPTAGYHVHADGHSPFILQFGWFFGNFFLIACLFGTYCALQQLMENVGGGFQFVGERPQSTLVYCAVVGFPMYLLGGFAGDLLYYQEEVAEIVRLIKGLCGVAIIVFIISCLATFNDKINNPTRRQHSPANGPLDRSAETRSAENRAAEKRAAEKRAAQRKRAKELWEPIDRWLRYDAESSARRGPSYFSKEYIELAELQFGKAWTNLYLGQDFRCNRATGIRWNDDGTATVLSACNDDGTTTRDRCTKLSDGEIEIGGRMYSREQLQQQGRAVCTAALELKNQDDKPESLWWTKWSWSGLADLDGGTVGGIWYSKDKCHDQVKKMDEWLENLPEAVEARARKQKAREESARKAQAEARQAQADRARDEKERSAVKKKQEVIDKKKKEMERLVAEQRKDMAQCKVAKERKDIAQCMSLLALVDEKANKLERLGDEINSLVKEANCMVDNIHARRS